MSLVDQLAEDFDVFLEDWGEDVTITHITAQALNAETGEYTTVSLDVDVEAIINPISVIELDIDPSFFKKSDITIYYKKEDLENIDLGDKILYKSNTYKILSVVEMKKIYKLICRKA